MNKSCSVMKNVREICAELRGKFFGEFASAKDYKDSFIINKAIESFAADPNELMAEVISIKENAETKVSKSVNFRSDCYEKIITLSKILNIPETEVLRRILYHYTLEQRSPDHESDDIQLLALKNKVLLLKNELETSLHTLNDVLYALENLGREN